MWVYRLIRCAEGVQSLLHFRWAFPHYLSQVCPEKKTQDPVYQLGTLDNVLHRPVKLNIGFSHAKDLSAREAQTGGLFMGAIMTLKWRLPAAERKVASQPPTLIKAWFGSQVMRRAIKR